jgi:hypothetical protein
MFTFLSQPGIRCKNGREHSVITTDAANLLLAKSDTAI